MGGKEQMETNEIFAYLGVTGPAGDGGQAQGGAEELPLDQRERAGQQGREAPPAGERGQGAETGSPAQEAPSGQEGQGTSAAAGGDDPARQEGGVPPMSPQERARNAQIRRQRETQEAVEKAVRAERQRQEQDLATVLREIGLRDAKGQPVTSMEELRAWKRATDLAKVQKDLKSGTLTMDGLSALIRETLRQSGRDGEGGTEDPPSRPGAAVGQSEGPARREAEQEAPGSPSGPTGAITQEQVDRELAEIHRLDPSVETLEDILGMETRDAFVAAVRHGNSFLDAFRLANFDRLLDSRRQEAAQRAAQAERNRTRSKEHMRPTGTRGEGSLAVPAETLALYRQLMPKATDAEIAAHYNKVAKDLK